MIRLSLLLLLATSGCVRSGPIPVADAAAPPFDPLAFFAGHTLGEGRLRVVLSGARTVRVDGTGHVGDDGTLTLVQRIDEEGKPARTRRWSLRRTGPATFGGTLSDAVGPVVAQVENSTLLIRFRGEGGVAIEQRIVLDPGGRVARNRLIATKLGVRVAVLAETIRKVD